MGCWVEIYRDADKQEKTAARFNEDLDDNASWKDGTWKKALKPPKSGGETSSTGNSSANASETVLKRDEQAGNANLHQRSTASQSSASATSEQQRPNQPRPNASSGSTSAGDSSAGAGAQRGVSSDARGASSEMKGEEESALPLYIGLAIFVLIVCYFAWQKFQEARAAWMADFQVGENW